MNKIILITGGARSGKSSYAEAVAEKINGERIYVATCPADQDNDPEMAMRIKGHIDNRLNRGWQTVEEEQDIVAVIEEHEQASVILVDCLTLWVSNLMFASHAEELLEEQEIEEHCQQLLRALRNHDGTLVLVTNEVGLGVVPENTLARRYRDLVGRCNQVIAAHADEVVLVSCGIPLYLKKA